MSRSIASSFVFPNLGDRLEMANSLEGRVPFLDQDLVKYAYSLPSNYFIDSKTLKGKKILRDAFATLIPPDLVSPPKHTFMAPRFMDIYNISNGKELISEYLGRELMMDFGILNRMNTQLIKLLWKSRVLKGSLALFVDSIIGLLMSVQVLYEHFIKEHPLKNIDWNAFKLQEHSSEKKNSTELI